MLNSELFIHEHDYPDFPADGAVEHLRQMLRFETTSYMDTSRIRYDAFDRMHAYIRKSYPHVAKAAVWEKTGYSLLLTLPGSDASLRPALFMAHQDVVPVVQGTEQDWLHGPFSGDLEDGYIWGRGAMDIKEMLVAILESAEYLLASGRSFRRRVYLAFGEDEETRSQGAGRIVSILASRGVELEYVLDEGAGDVTDAADYGAPGVMICPVGLCERGYADMKLVVRSKGGHSSNPFHGTSLGCMAQAIHRILTHMPDAHLSDVVLHSLKSIAPFVTEEPMKTWVRDPQKYTEELIGWMLRHESTYYQVRTTAAPTMIRGGSEAGNVMPQDMEAVINFRLCQPDTPERLIEHFAPVVGPEVELSYVQCIGPSVPSDPEAWGFAQLLEVLQHYFDRLVFIPALNRAATDARQYECLSRCVLRFGPFLEEEDISKEGIHGTNERISVRAYLQGIRVILRLMEQTCCEKRGNLE